MSTRILPVSLDVRMYCRGRPRIVPSSGCLSRVKRCLFGLPSSSPEESIQQAAAELKRQSDDDSKRWNFDFVNERKKDGRFDWQSADEPNRSVENNESSVVVVTSPSARLRQSQITEFLQPRKRTSSGVINNKRLRTSTSSPRRT